MARAFKEQLTDPNINGLAFEDRFGLLVDQEWTSRKNNHLKRLIKQAKFSETGACVEDIEYHSDRNLDSAQIARLASCNYITERHNILLLGATGSGKTYLACALGMAAVRNFLSVRYVRLPELLTELAIARSSGNYRKVIQQYKKPAYDVGFVIIDFKGGGMANQFKDLPHMMGAITNIDGREINRSLLSIKAELVKRQSLFAQAGVNHINDYIKLFKKGAVEQPLPHLIIIVDEFAELKAEFPDFMKELISAARIGRTLGVHLILATQKPAGVVDAQIWSNSKFKLCLKVQTKEDSNEVIKTPLAAEIVEPGRAYFQVGNNEIFELFQSAYSGVKVTDDGDDKSKICASLRC